MNTTLATTSQPSMGDMERMALAIAKSGLFGMKSPEQALALGLLAVSENKPFASICAEYDVIQGRPALKSQACLARFQQAGGTIQWIKRTDDECTIEGKHPSGGSLQVTWSMDRAKAAGLTGKSNWKTYPCAMLSARCVAELVRAIYPACLNGVYLAEEVQDFDAKPLRIEKAEIKVEKPVIALEEPAPIVAEIVEETPTQEAPEEPEAAPVTPLDTLASIMWQDEINDAHVIEFLIANKMPKVTRKTLLTELPEKVIERLISKWDAVKAFKPAI
jgi:hypothetical protein